MIPLFSTALRSVLVLCVLSLLPPVSFAKSCVTRTSGNWNVVSTWSGCQGTIPGAGDSARIARGHTLTIPLGYTAVIGPDDGTSVALLNDGLVGAGILVVNGTLRFKGHVEQGNATWIVNSDGGVTSQGRLEHAGEKAHYTWQIGMMNNQLQAILKLKGSGRGAGRVVVTNAPGAVRFGGFTQGSAVRNNIPNPVVGLTGAGRIEAHWTQFRSLGVSGSDFITANLNYRDAALSFVDSLVEDCTLINVVSSIHPDAVFRFNRSSITNPVDKVSISVTAQAGSSPNGAREVVDSVIEGAFSSPHGSRWRADRTIFAGKAVAGGVPWLAGTNMKFDSFDDVLIWNRSATAGDTITPPVGIANRLISVRGNSGDNDHFRKNTRYNIGDTTINGCISERANPGDFSGATFILYGAVDAANHTAINNCIDVPGYRDGLPSTGALVCLIGNAAAKTTVSITNTTRKAGGNHLFSFEGQEHGYQGAVTGMKNNLLWLPAPGAGKWVKKVAGIARGTITGADYNGAVNISTADRYEPDDSIFSNPSPPGPHDRSLTVAPGRIFVDSTRNMLTWARQFDRSITTYPQILSRLLLKNHDSGYDPRFNHQDYYRYLRAGFAPVGASLTIGGAGGELPSYLGAVPPNSGRISVRNEGRSE